MTTPQPSPATIDDRNKGFTQLDWATDFLKAGGFPVTENNLVSVLTWMHLEGGHFVNNARFNPINTTLAKPGATNIPGNTAGVKAYPDYQTGMDATISTLREDQRGYANIRSALAQSAPPAMTLTAITTSSWGTKATVSGLGPQFAANLKVVTGKIVNRPTPVEGDYGPVTPAAPNPLLDKVPTPPGLSAVESFLQSVGNMIAWASHPHNLVRILQVALGGVGLVVGVLVLNSDSLPSLGTTAKTAATVAAL